MSFIRYYLYKINKLILSSHYEEILFETVKVHSTGQLAA
jgi:hypothetical protein